MYYDKISKNNFFSISSHNVWGFCKIYAYLKQKTKQNKIASRFLVESSPRP